MRVALLPVLLAASVPALGGPLERVDAVSGGRPAALGGAYGALASDSYGPLFNPAALARVLRPEASVGHAAYGGSSAQTVTAAMPLWARHGAGVSARRYESSSDWFDELRVAGAAGLSTRLSLGLAGRFVRARAGRASQEAAAADAGLFYRVDSKLSASAAVSSLGRRAGLASDSEAMASLYRLGAAYRPWAALAFSLEGVGQDARLGLRSGLEWRVLRLAALRAGVDTWHAEGSGERSLGVTAGFGLEAGGHGFDLAWLPGRGGGAALLSATLRFGPGRGEEALAELPEAGAPRARREKRWDGERAFRLEPDRATEAPDWDKPKAPQIPEKPGLEEPVQPALLWIE